MKKNLVSAAILGVAVVGLADQAFAGGVIRDPNRATANHSAFALGGSGAVVNNWGSENPTLSANFNAGTASSGTAGLWTDLLANGTTNSQAQSIFGATTTTSNQLSALSWTAGFLNANRVNIGNLTGASFATTQGFTGNTGFIKFANVGTGSWRADVTVTSLVTDGATLGSVNVYSVLTVQRVAFSADPTPNGNVNFTVGILGDMDLGTSGAGDTLQLISSERIRFNDSVIAGLYGEIFAPGATSFGTGLRSTAAGNLAATTGANAVYGAGQLSNNIGGTLSDAAAGFVWSRSLAPVGQPGDRVQIELAVSINQTAVVPEPAALGLLAPGILMLARRRRA